MPNELSLFDDPEAKAIELMIGEKKSATETSAYLKDHGYDYSPVQLRRIKKNAFETLVLEMKDEMTAEFILNSIQKVTIEFEDHYQRYKKILEKLETKDTPTFEMLSVMREMKDMLSLSLKKMGQFSHGLESVKADTINVINNSDVIMAVQQNQDKLFKDMQPEFVDGKLVFNKPSAELVDAYHKWKFNSKRVTILQ